MEKKRYIICFFIIAFIINYLSITIIKNNYSLNNIDYEQNNKELREEINSLKSSYNEKVVEYNKWKDRIESLEESMK